MIGTAGIFLDLALRYADLGYHVFPCVPGDKKPITAHGLYDATTALSQIERWWAKNPSANVAIATTGLVVIDIDGASNPWLNGDLDRMIDMAIGPLAITPRGGRHHLFRQPAGRNWRNTASKLAPKVDTRANGGYIVVAPSIVGVNSYRWVPGLELDEPLDRLPEPPDWLVAELDRLAKPSQTTAKVAANAIESSQIPEGKRNVTLTSYAGTMRRSGMDKSAIAAALFDVNKNHCKPPLPNIEIERIAVSVARYAPDRVAAALGGYLCDQVFEEESTDDEVPDTPDPGAIPDRLLQVPGFISEVMAYTLKTAPYPEKSLAFGGALSLLSHLTGRKVRDPGDNRTNLYILGLANSGAGKDWPRKVNQKILWEVGLIDSVGDAFASGEGIEDRMFLHPSVLFQTDEIDGLMTKINLGFDVHSEGIMNTLLKMYTSSNAIYSMRAKAGREHRAIDQPSLSIFGTAIPKHYYEALSPKMLTNGFFARMLVLETGNRGRGQNANIMALPDSVLKTAQHWAEYSPEPQRGNRAALHPVPRIVQYTPLADVAMQIFRQQAEEQYSLAESKDDQGGMAIWARANEKACRLALIYACSENHLNPEISADAARWACELVGHQTRRMLFMAAEHVSENEFDARCKKLVVTLRNWQRMHGDAWMPFWQINRKHKWNQRDHEDVRTTLLHQRMIEYDFGSNSGRPGQRYRLVPTS